MRSSFYNRRSIAELSRLLDENRPDVVQIQNVFPLVSLASLKLIKSKGYPIVMRCPNYRLFCPTGLFVDAQGEVCEQCTGFFGELSCVIKNCESNIAKSTAYATRNAYARLSKGIIDFVDRFIVQTEFQFRKFVEHGIPESKLVIVPGFSHNAPIMNTTSGSQEHISFIGRISEAKGIGEFVQAAARFPEYKFVVAGALNNQAEKWIKESTNNIDWLGFLSGKELDTIYIKSKVVVAASKWYEGFPNVILKAMLHNKPVITSNLGAMSTIVEHRKTGYLIGPGSVDDLCKGIRELTSDNDLAQRMGAAAGRKARMEYTPERVIQILTHTYKELSRSDS